MAALIDLTDVTFIGPSREVLNELRDVLHSAGAKLVELTRVRFVLLDELTASDLRGLAELAEQRARRIAIAANNGQSCG